MFAGGILANPRGKDHVPLEFCASYDDMRRAFEIAGQGKMPADVLDAIATHKSVVYLRFPFDVIGQKSRLLKFTTLIRDLGGYAVKIESAGVAYTWEVWQDLILNP
ncbi:hypothetical protein DSOUD_2886 [Desulfuromonas soudanensis]|uniref:Uncharacterized protein n=2 Tax=Desulfuromonas soudanensis TaxID=1603606 RepID=A0A0M4CYN1_9BACT|nr:hypothetical protein DSOUD_2886 [Desulfuromonas soudanensis]